MKNKQNDMFDDGDFLNWLSDHACIPTCGNFFSVELKQFLGICD